MRLPCEPRRLSIHNRKGTEDRCVCTCNTRSSSTTRQCSCTLPGHERQRGGTRRESRSERSTTPLMNQQTNKQLMHFKGTWLMRACIDNMSLTSPATWDECRLQESSHHRVQTTTFHHSPPYSWLLGLGPPQTRCLISHPGPNDRLPRAAPCCPWKTIKILNVPFQRHPRSLAHQARDPEPSPLLDLCKVPALVLRAKVGIDTQRPLGIFENEIWCYVSHALQIYPKAIDTMIHVLE